MSTTAIREALSALHLTTLRSNEWTPEYHAKIDAAADAIEAIERASKALTTDEVRRALRHAPEDVRMALGVLESIAKDAP